MVTDLNPLPEKKLEAVLKEFIKSVNGSQHSGSFSFGNHCAGRTAEVQIHFFIAEFHHLHNRKDEHLGVVGDYLRYKIRYKIVHRIGIPELSCGEGKGIIGRQKRGIETVYPRKTLLEGITERISGNAFHRCEIKFHIIFYLYIPLNPEEWKELRNVPFYKPAPVHFCHAPLALCPEAPADG